MTNHVYDNEDSYEDDASQDWNDARREEKTNILLTQDEILGLIYNYAKGIAEEGIHEIEALVRAVDRIAELRKFIKDEE